jgi:hypothetical protein
MTENLGHKESKSIFNAAGFSKKPAFKVASHPIRKKTSIMEVTSKESD